MKSRAAALAVGSRAARRLDIPLWLAMMIAFAARKHGIRWAVAFALIEQESNFRNIYGHDAGGLLPGQPVTKRNYRGFREEVVRREGGGSNGVGFPQITYWTYIRDHKRLDKPRVQLYLGMSILAEYISSSATEKEAIGKYNGGPNNPVWTYADSVLAHASRIRPLLKGKKQ